MRQGERSVPMSTTMNFNDFKNKVMEDLTCRLRSEGFPVQLISCTLPVNNGILEEKIEIRCIGRNISPCVPIRTFYSIYMHGENYDAIIDKIVSFIKDNFKKPEFPANKQKIEENFERNIYFRLINADLNKELLSQVPHRMIDGLDLAVTYRIRLNLDDDGAASFIIKNNEYGYSEEELYRMAMKNTPIIYETMFVSICDFLVARGYIDVSGIIDNENILYVLTNKHDIDGAAVILYPGCLERVSKKMEDIYGTGDFYMLPSSIHEMMISTCQTNFTERELADFVCSANRLVVSERERLSNNLYRYRKSTGKLEIVRV